MITFWVNRAGAFGIENYLANRGKPLRDRFAVRVFDWQESFEVTAGPQVFAGLDRITPAEREGVAELYDQLAKLQPGVPLLNDPRRCLLRFELLERLADEGLNSFRAYRAHDSARVARFPVFVREASEHSGSLTGLLDSPAELRRALIALRLRGYQRADLLIVEFCDTSDQNGVFRKYSAMKVGDRIVATHLMGSQDWVVKSESLMRSADLVREEIAYAEQNPYAEWLGRVFALAGIDYGRIDFGVLRGKPQAWEINLNPTIGRAPGVPPREEDPEVAALRLQSREIFHGNLVRAFAALDRSDVQGSLRLTLDRNRLTQIDRDIARSLHREPAMEFLRRMYHRPRLGAPLRALLRGFLRLR